jgi:RNA polymerase sigma-70 factor (ECF subfamily)
MTNDTDKLCFISIQQGSHEGLRFLFDRYYISLCRYVHTLIEDESTAEDIVQGVFIYIWEHRLDIALTGSVRAYLFTACRNKALNHLRDMRKFTRFVPEQYDSIYEEMSVETDDLHRLIEEAVTSLPEKCAKIFRMSREDDLSYKEIAEREGIAVKTVEAQIHTALKRLKKYLATHLKIFL